VINKAVPVREDYTTDNLKQTIGNVTAVTVTPNSGKSDGARTVFYQVSGTSDFITLDDVKAAGAGSFSVSFDVAASQDGNWAKADKLFAGTLLVESVAQVFEIRTISFDGGSTKIPYDEDFLPTVGYQFGADIVPDLEVYFSGFLLVEDTDFKVEWTNNKDKGDVAIGTITGLGDKYSDKPTATAKFNIGAHLDSLNTITFFWTDEHGDLIANGATVRLWKGETLTIRSKSDTSKYTVAQWRVDGVAAAGASGDTFDFTDVWSKSLGDHVVSLLVKDTENPEKLFNTNITITVVEWATP